MLSFNHYLQIIKVHAFAWTLIIISIYSKAQLPYNLVRNYSFESYSVCCSAGNSGADFWGGATIKANIQYSYLNVCCTNANGGVPSNLYGGSWQYPRTGNAYIGIGTSANNGNSLRNYAQTKLTDSLKSNHCYYIEFYVNLVDNAKYSNNNIALLVGDTAIRTYNNKYAPANPQIQLYGNPCISDTMNWVQVAGVYTAHGGEQYITIGNFKDDAHTDTLLIGGSYITGYYIDDVSVIPLDSMQLKADAGNDTTINIGDSVWVGSLLCGLTTQWFDADGNNIANNVPGMWVKPVSNTYYILEQNECGQLSADTVYITVNPLPVTLLSFKVSVASPTPPKEGLSEQVLVNWETATEINVSHFNVQRSVDGVNFEMIGTVKAKGAGSYTFNDPLTIHDSRFTTLYYRLEVIDNDGKKTYSEIKELSIINYQLSITPNPTTGIVNIQLPTSGNWQIIATDLGGRIIWQQECSGCTGVTKNNLSGSKGLYFIKIINITTGQQYINKITLL